MITSVVPSLRSIQRLVGDSQGDFATTDFVLGYMETAQRMLFNEILALPIANRATAIVIVPRIEVGARTVASQFQAGGLLETLSDITTLKERAVTSYSESDWIKMAPTLSMPGFTPGSYNHVYQFTGTDITLPGADQALSLRVYGHFEPHTLVSEDSVLVPGTGVIIEFRAAQLILDPRGNGRLARQYEGEANKQQDAYLNRIVQQSQDTPIRQKSRTGRMRSSL